MVVEQVEINGLLWDTENLNENGQKLYSWVEAKIYADKMGKRIPKIDEVKALFSSGFEFDYKNNGVWVFGKRLFFPLSWNIFS